MKLPLSNSPWELWTGLSPGSSVLRYLFSEAPFQQESVDVDELCPICCAVKISVRFIPCRHASCRLVSCDSWYWRCHCYCGIKIITFNCLFLVLFLFLLLVVFLAIAFGLGTISILIGNFNKVENKIIIKMLSEDVTTA